MTQESFIIRHSPVPVFESDPKQQFQAGEALESIREGAEYLTSPLELHVQSIETR